MPLHTFTLDNVIFHLDENKHTIAGAKWGESCANSANWPHNVMSVLSDSPDKARKVIAEDFWKAIEMNAETYGVFPSSFSLGISEGAVTEGGRFWLKPLGRQWFVLSDLLKKV